MWNGIKLWAVLAAILVMALLPITSNAEIIGFATGTDIVAYINNNPIPSYNINGCTAVITSDLANYGFSYHYDNSSRRVDLTFTGRPPSPISFWRDQRTYGRPIANVLATDIKVFVNGIPMQSFNIDGLTAIYFSDLKMFGPVEYDNSLRSAFLTIASLPMAQYHKIEERATAVASVNYQWSTDKYNWSYTLNIPVADYDKLSAIPRSQLGINNYAAYAAYSANKPYAKALADCFKNTADEYALSDMETVEVAVAFVQSLQYVSDMTAKGEKEYVSFPVETLFEKQGDCEDTSILLACILKEMGYGVVLLDFPEAENGHMAVGLKGSEGIEGTYYTYNSQRFYYIETTQPGWKIGMTPDSVKGKSARIISF